MRLRAFTTLFVGILAYSISIIIGLILNLPLEKVFTTGLIVLVFTGFSVWLLLFTLEYCADKKEDEKKVENLKATSVSAEKLSNVDKKETEINSNNDEMASDGFSPLTPPVLEVEQEAHNRGE